MKIFEKMWWVFGLFMICSYLLNPYVGFFSLFPIVTTFITFCAFVNIKSRNKKTVAKQAEFVENIYEDAKILNSDIPIADVLEKSARITKKITSIVMYVWLIIFGLINVFVETMIWFLASGNLKLDAKYVTPWIIWSEPGLYNISIMLLVSGIWFSVLTCVASWLRLSSLMKEF